MHKYADVKEQVNAIQPHWTDVMSPATLVSQSQFHELTGDRAWPESVINTEG